MSSVTMLAQPDIIDKMQQHYKSNLIQSVPYSIFRAKINTVTITAYTSGKVLFQGSHAEEEAQKWSSQHVHTDHQEFPKKSSSNRYNQLTLIGSDEVGNGSYFGSLTVCAVYLSPEDFELARELGVKDSKLLTDRQIREIAWQLKESFTHHLTICDPNKYNQNIDRLNAVGIKVSLHNFTIQRLINKLSPEQLSNLDGVLIDEFTSEKNYTKYVLKETNPYRKHLYFEKKAESIHLSVACASIIAREAFLSSLERLGKEFGIILPSGAGTNVDRIGKQLVQKYGSDILTQLAKVHFKNTQKILH